MPKYIIPTERGRRIINRLREKANDKRLKRFKVAKDELSKELHASYRRNRGDLRPVNFQHPTANTLVIYDENSTEIYRCKGPISEKRLNRISNAYPKATVLVELGQGIFKQLPISTFRKLIKIKFVMFQRDYEFFGIDDFEPVSKSGDWFTPEAVIDNIYSINQLLKVFVIEESFDKANDVYLSARFYHLTGVEKVCKILYQSGKTEQLTYEKFLKKYDLDIAMNLFEEKPTESSKKPKKGKKSKSNRYTIGVGDSKAASKKGKKKSSSKKVKGKSNKKTSPSKKKLSSYDKRNKSKKKKKRK